MIQSLFNSPCVDEFTGLQLNTEATLMDLTMENRQELFWFSFFLEANLGFI